MEVSLRPIGGLRETASPFDPALWRMVFLQSFTSAEGKRNGNTSVLSEWTRRNKELHLELLLNFKRINMFRLRIPDVHRLFVSTKDIMTDGK